MRKLLGRYLWKIEVQYHRARTTWDFRTACLGGCGRMVLKYQAECRKCKKHRLHQGLKRVKRAQREQNA